MKENKPVVLFLCKYQSVYGGNFIPSLIAIEEALNGKGIQCVYAFPPEAEIRDWFKQLEQTGKKVLTFDFNNSRLQQVKNLSALIKQYDINIIHLHFTQIVPFEIFAFLHKDIKVFIHLHSDFSLGKQSFKTKIKNWFIYKFLSGRVHFISVSKAFVNYNPVKITWIPNALAVKRMPCKHISGAEIRRQYNIGKDEILCEILGWSPQVKGVDIAVEAIKRLNLQGGKYKLAIVCGREMTIDKMPLWVKGHTSCSGREDFLLYFHPKEDVFAYHEATDILISASRSEGFPYSILEMLSLGKPCVISDIPGVTWAKKYPLSFPFKNEDVEECFKAVKQAGKGVAEDIKNNIVKQIQKDYDINNWVKQVLKEYEK